MSRYNEGKSNEDYYKACCEEGMEKYKRDQKKKKKKERKEKEHRKQSRPETAKHVSENKTVKSNAGTFPLFLGEEESEVISGINLESSKGKPNKSNKSDRTNISDAERTLASLLAVRECSNPIVIVNIHYYGNASHLDENLGIIEGEFEELEDEK